VFIRGFVGGEGRRLHAARVVGEAWTWLAAARARRSSVRDSESIQILAALAPSLSLFGLGMLFFAKAAFGERLSLSAFLVGTAMLVLPAVAALLMALAWSSQALGRILPERRLRAATLIALLTAALSSLVVALPLREGDETHFNEDAGARTADMSVRPAEEAAPRQGYCLGRDFYDLAAGQPDHDPIYRGAVPAYVDPSTGAVSCDFPPAG
jgi:hypothetical protein